MENDKELREKLSKILGAPYQKKSAYDYDTKIYVYSWEEIFNEIGKLQERANPEPQIIEKYAPNPIQVNQPSNPNLHYHNNAPCYNNPCIWS